MSDQTAAITHHEAGHAVAVLMTVLGDLDGPVTVSMVAGRGTGNAKITRWVAGQPAQVAFVFYAGPWAEARAQWAHPVLGGLDESDDRGIPFREAVIAAFKDAPHFGGGSDLAMYMQQVRVDPSIPSMEAYWSGDLECAWPAIQKLAAALRDGLSSADPEPGPYSELPANRDRVMRKFEIPAGEVLALVQPLLEARGIWRSVG
ncbi:MULTISPECIES: hypothetical protein [Mycobacteriaceae]|uniref:hypothetical protein n=1 Tax=Mycobacteriaceae TaxID=1762 RepID=UPI001CD96DFB|nr:MULTISPECIES: hypothetical protein [unclassified Mycobacterium]MCA2244873.1 hypothetical protein [Mycobacterium sp. WUMAC-067]MCA2316270.1 hypothetical protein [Mycobacterium sp. WUMAC-025]